MKVRFFELPAGLRITQMQKGLPEFGEFTERETAFLMQNIKPNSVILDVGCGWGKHLFILSSHTKLAVGIDSSRMMIEKAVEHLKELPNVKLFLADAEKMPFEKNFFDFVICTRNTFGNFLNKKAVLGEMKRVLKPNGKILIGIFSQKAKNLQAEYYKKNRLKITRVTKKAFYAWPDFKSERFTKKRIKSLLKAGKLKAKIIPLNNIALECIASKN